MNRVFALLVAVVAVLFYVNAFADAGGAVASASGIMPENISVWTGVVVTALAIGAWALRAFTADTSFAHTKNGALVIALVCAVATAVSEVIRTKGLHLSAILPAIMGAVAPLLAMSNPTNVAEARAEAKNQGSGTGSGGTQAAMFLALLSVFMAVPGCAHSTFGTNFGSCMAGRGIKEGSAVAKDIEGRVIDSLAQGKVPDDVVTQLEGIGVGIAAQGGTDLVSCLVSAWLSQTGKALNPAGVEGGRKYLAKHPSSARRDHRLARHGVPGSGWPAQAGPGCS